MATYSKGDLPDWGAYTSGGRSDDRYAGYAHSRDATGQLGYTLLGEAAYNPQSGQPQSGEIRATPDAWKLDEKTQAGKDWKTHWSIKTGHEAFGKRGHGWGYTQQAPYAPGIRLSDYWYDVDPDATGRAAYSTGLVTAGYDPDKPRHQQGYEVAARQVLDWGAYDKDYKDWLTHMGKKEFKSLEDIYAAETWFDEQEAAKYGSNVEAYDDTAIRSQLEGLTSDLSNYQGSNQQEINKLLTRVGDLENLGIEISDVGDLQDQLNKFLTQENVSQFLTQEEVSKYTGDKLEAFKGTQDDYIQTQLDTLGGTLRGEFAGDIKDLDIAGIKSDIQQSEGDITALSDKFTGLSTDIAGFKGTTTSDINALFNQLATTGADLGTLKTDLATGLTGLEGRTQTALTSALQGVGTDLTDLESRQQTALASAIETSEAQTGQKIEGVKGDVSTLGAVQAGLTGDVSGLQTDVSGLQTGLTSLAGDMKAADKAIETAYTKAIADQGTSFTQQLGSEIGKTEDKITQLGQTQSQALSDLGTKFQGDLQAQGKDLTAQMEQGLGAMDTRLSKIASSMNYRMLGDSALGIRNRRSRAFKSGDTQLGTGQLNRLKQSQRAVRQDKIKHLNI
jgi:outer membrane murein-binding lipoprotein Lpp